MVEKAEDILAELFDGFDEIFFFDPDVDKSGTVTQKYDKQEPVEIDCIARKDNILFLVNVYDGIRIQEIDSKFKKFFRRLKYLDSLQKLNLNVDNHRSVRGKENLKNINQVKKRLNESGRITKIVKLGFCPKLHVPTGKLPLEQDESLIDKKHTTYFRYALENVGPDYLERELLYFFNIKRREIGLRIGTRAGNEPELTSDFKAIELNIGNGINMYSTCVSVREIIEFCQVMRVADEYNPDAFQRMVNGSRIREISEKYLSNQMSFPNNIILAFNPKFYKPELKNNFINEEGENSKIKIYKEFGSLIIIDGQHRLLSHLVNPNRDIDKSILINIVFFTDSDEAFRRMSELFYSINTKHKKLASLVSLKIRSNLDPEAIESIWYKIFKNLNELNQRDNYLNGKISFEEKELRHPGENKINISSIVNYSGVKRTIKGEKKKTRVFLGLENLSINQGKTTQDQKFEYYMNFVRKYFSVIGEMLEGNDYNIGARDLGSLLRLITHFINDAKTKEIFEEMGRETQALSEDLKNRIKEYLDKIPFDKLEELDYPSNSWATMEGFFLGCIRRYFPGFGLGPLLSKKGKNAIHKGREFVR